VGRADGSSHYTNQIAIQAAGQARWALPYPTASALAVAMPHGEVFDPHMDV
jgi:hypothetical protein